MSKVAYVSLVLERKLCHPWHSVDSIACHAGLHMALCMFTFVQTVMHIVLCYIIGIQITGTDTLRQSVGQLIGRLHHVFP